MSTFDLMKGWGFSLEIMQSDIARMRSGEWSQGDPLHICGCMTPLPEEGDKVRLPTKDKDGTKGFALYVIYEVQNPGNDSYVARIRYEGIEE